MIKQKNISIIANNSNKNGKRRIPESVIEKDYCIAWFLFGLSQLDIKNDLIFKGGTLLRRCYFPHYRFSEDLDFTLTKEIPLNQILEEFEKIYLWVKDETGIFFNTSRLEPSSENTHTFYIAYEGPLPGGLKEIKVDITFKEIILTPIEEKNIIKTYNEYDDFLAEAKIHAYALNEVLIEKTCALYSPARNEPRDLYDIHYLIENAAIATDFLPNDVIKKMAFKSKKFDQTGQVFLKKEKRLKQLWEKRLEQQMISLPEFDDIFRSVKRTFRQAGLVASN